MVYTVPPRNAPNASFGNQLGQSLSQGFLSAAQPAIQQQYQRGQLQQALNRLRMQGQNPNASPTDLLYNLIEASSYSPEIGRNLPQLYAELNKAREANAMKNVNYGENQSNEQTSFKPGGISRPTREMSPEFQEAIQESKFFPSNVGAQEETGNLPQEATQGKVKPILSGDELLKKTQQRQAEFARNGIIKTFEDVYNQVKSEHEENKAYNQIQEQERKNRIQSQRDYGKIAVERLSKLVPDASDKLKDVFRKIGEKAASGDRSEGDIGRYISEEVEKYKNSISNIEKDLEAPRIQNRLKRSFQGKSTDLKIAMKDAKGAIQPLLDLELYDQARTMLSKAGFAPEEREQIIFGELPKQIKETVNNIPKATYMKKERMPISGVPGVPTYPGEFPKQYDIQSQVNLYDSLSSTFNENPSVNLLLLRKAYEDKGYDWRSFKNALNELRENGHIQLNDDQQNIYNSYLNNPPLDKIGQILHGLGIIGR